MRERLRSRAALLLTIVAIGLAVLGTYTWRETRTVQCPPQGVCLVGQQRRIHPLRARIEWAAALVLVVGAASIAVTGRRRRRQ
jgi:hypothetical protein